MNSQALAEMGKLVAADIASGEMGRAAQVIIGTLEQQPERVTDIIDGLIAKGAAPEPDEDLIAADLLIICRLLDIIRYGVEAGHAAEMALADRVREQLCAANAEGRIDANLLLLILTQFSEAKLDVGDRLRAAILRSVEAKVAEKAPTTKEGGETLRAMLTEAGNNSFDAHTIVAASAMVMPEAVQATLAQSLAAEKNETLGCAALGFLLSASGEVRRALCRTLAQLQPGLGAACPVGLRRMIAMRNWLPAADRSGLDTAIKALRQKGVECALWTAPAKVEAYVSGFDGSGMQCIFVVVPDGRKQALAAMIGRLGMGVRDAWVKRGITKREIKSMVGATNGQIGMTPISLDYVGMAVRQFLAANEVSGLPPPFGLLALAEVTGLSNVNPETITAESMVKRLTAAMEPERLSPAAVRNSVARSAEWPYEHRVFESWFEEGDEVDRLLRGKHQSKAKRVAALSGPVASSRRRWAELLAWTALTAKEQMDGPDWRDLAIVAREFLTDRPIDHIPLAQYIAEQTVEVHAARSK